VRIVPLVVVALFLALPATVLAAPANDDFANAIDLASIDEGFFVGSNVGATKEAGEPDHAGNPGGKSVWFTWTAPLDDSVPHVAVLADALIDTILGVYTGSAVNALSEVASNDDTNLGGSSVSFPTTPGTTYRIAIDGFAGKAGVIFVAAFPSPVNDNFSEAIALTGAAGTRTGDTLDGSTTELGEMPFGTEQSVWYSFQPPADGMYKLSTFGTRGVDTVLTVYEGTAVESLTQVAVNDDDPDRGCCSSWVPLENALASKTYMIQITPLDALGDTSELTLSWGPLILGTEARDTILGTPASEEIRGLGGNDVIVGGNGADLIFGGTGNDRTDGKAGSDLIFDRRGIDVLQGSGGLDVLDARDRMRGDHLLGGPGRDSCNADRTDSKRGCP
jgi:Ca2+-binding RTX toxin-like protein